MKNNNIEIHEHFEGGYKQAPLVFLKQFSSLKVTAAYESYWRFAAERQHIFFKRLKQMPPPWTINPIMGTYKFTNAYRASDRVSQYLIRSIIYRDDLSQSLSEVFFRIILFKLFNKIETWQLLEDKLGEVRYSEYNFNSYSDILTQAMQSGVKIYSGAYIMPPGSSVYGFSYKHQNHLKLLERMMDDHLVDKIAEANSMHAVFNLLRSYPLIGDFLAYQYTTDLNYSTITNFSEMDFVIPGPGARDGLRKCFADTSKLHEVDLIKLIADEQEKEFDRFGLRFPSLWGRRLQLIDCQNLFCEIDKFSRIAHPEILGKTGRTRIKQKFNQSFQPISFFYPPKWGINDHITAQILPNEISGSSFV